MINPAITLEDLQKMNAGNMCEHVGIEYTELGKDYIVAKMPVDHRTTQPMGLLHGGASVVLAETLGSIGAFCCIDPDKQYCVGLEINANHIRSVSKGFVFGKASAIHIGKSTQIWEIRITDETDKLVCISRITMAVIDRK